MSGPLRAVFDPQKVVADIAENKATLAVHEGLVTQNIADIAENKDTLAVHEGLVTQNIARLNKAEAITDNLYGKFTEDAQEHVRNEVNTRAAAGPEKNYYFVCGQADERMSGVKPIFGYSIDDTLTNVVTGELFPEENNRNEFFSTVNSADSIEEINNDPIQPIASQSKLTWNVFFARLESLGLLRTAQSIQDSIPENSPIYHLVKNADGSKRQFYHPDLDNLIYWNYGDEEPSADLYDDYVTLKLQDGTNKCTFANVAGNYDRIYYKKIPNKHEITIRSIMTHQSGLIGLLFDARADNVYGGSNDYMFDLANSNPAAGIFPPGFDQVPSTQAGVSPISGQHGIGIQTNRFDFSKFNSTGYIDNGKNLAAIIVILKTREYLAQGPGAAQVGDVGPRPVSGRIPGNGGTTTPLGLNTNWAAGLPEEAILNPNPETDYIGQYSEFRDHTVWCNGRLTSPNVEFMAENALISGLTCFDPDTDFYYSAHLWGSVFAEYQINTALGNTANGPLDTSGTWEQIQYTFSREFVKPLGLTGTFAQILEDDPHKLDIDNVKSRFIGIRQITESGKIITGSVAIKNSRGKFANGDVIALDNPFYNKDPRLPENLVFPDGLEQLYTGAPDNQDFIQTRNCVPSSGGFLATCLSDEHKIFKAAIGGLDKDGNSFINSEIVSIWLSKEFNPYKSYNNIIPSDPKVGVISNTLIFRVSTGLGSSFMTNGNNVIEDPYDEFEGEFYGRRYSLENNTIDAGTSWGGANRPGWRIDTTTGEYWVYLRNVLNGAEENYAIFDNFSLENALKGKRTNAMYQQLVDNSQVVASINDLINMISNVNLKQIMPSIQAILARLDALEGLATSTLRPVVPLATVPPTPPEITPVTPVKSYIPVSDQTGIQVAQLVSLYAKGTDGKVATELVTGQLENGTIAVVDIILSSSANDVPTVEIANVSNLMTVSSIRDASVFGTFKVLSQSGPGPVIVGTYDTTALANSRFYQIRGYSRTKIYPDDITLTNELDTSKEYDFEMRTENNKRQIYLRETGTTSWIKDFTDYSNDNLPVKQPSHPSAPFGFVANSNVVLRNLKLDSPYYTQNTDFRDKAPLVDAAEVSGPNVTKIALIGFVSVMNDRSIGYLQVPNDGLWSSAPDDLGIHMVWDNPFGLQNEYTINNYTSNNYTSISQGNFDKLVGLQSSIPSSLTGILESLKAGATGDEQEIIRHVQHSSNVVYLERVERGFGSIKVFPLLIDTVGHNLVGLEVELETPLTSSQFNGLALTGQASVVETYGVKTDGTHRLDIVKGPDDLGVIGTGPGQIAKFSDFVNTTTYKTAYPNDTNISKYYPPSVANYLTQLSITQDYHSQALNDRVSKSALHAAGLTQTVNSTIGTNPSELNETDIAGYLARVSKVQSDQSYFLDNSVVSKEKFRSLTAGFTEFKKVEFNLPVTPAPSTNVFDPPPVNNGYIRVRDEDLITVNALVSMFNKGVINNSWNVDFINAPDDNGFVRNIDNVLTGVDHLMSGDPSRALMCVKPESSFTLSMSFMVKDATDWSDFFMYAVAPNTSTSNDWAGFFNAKVLDINSVVSTAPYASKGVDALTPDRLENLDSALHPNVFYNLKIIKTGNSITFTITTEDGLYIGSGSDTVSNNAIKWGLLNNKNVSVKSIVMEGVTWYIGNGEDLTGDWGAYKIQAGIDNNDFIVSYRLNEGPCFEVINISGSFIQSKFKSQKGSSQHIQTTGDLQFVYALSDVEQHLIYDINGLRNRSDGLLLGIDEYDLSTEINSIPKTNDNDKQLVTSLAHFQENDNTVVLVQGVTGTFDVNDINTILGISAVFVVRIEIDGTTKELVTTPTVARTDVTLPAPYSFGDHRLSRIFQQSPRNDPSIESDLIDKNSFFHIVTGVKDVTAYTADDVEYKKPETHIFILFNGDLVATIPVKDKLGTKPLDRSYYKGPPPTDDSPSEYEVINYNEVILLGSQIIHPDTGSPSTYLYLCYAADVKGAPISVPYSDVVRSNTYQKLCRIDMDAVLTEHAASSAPVELNIVDTTTISYFSEDPSLVREPKDYISPISCYPTGQHINITSNAMVSLNREHYFMRKMSIYELDLDNLYFKNRVDYESSINEDRRSNNDRLNQMGPYRVAISQDYLNVIAGGNHLYSVNLESSFSKGRAAQINEYLPPIEYLPEVDDADFQLTGERVSILDPLPVPFLYTYDNIIPLDDTNTDLTNAKSISVTLDGTLTVDSETYTYDYATQRYTSETNPDNYYTVSDETGNSFSWNTEILLDRFPVVLASPNLGGQKWLGFKTLDPQWGYRQYALNLTLLDGGFYRFWPDYSHETDVVPGHPNLVYMGLGSTLVQGNFWDPTILKDAAVYGVVVVIADLATPPA